MPATFVANHLRFNSLITNTCSTIPMTSHTPVPNAGERSRSCQPCKIMNESIVANVHSLAKLAARASDRECLI